jgi:hypothetical protein
MLALSLAEYCKKEEAREWSDCNVTVAPAGYRMTASSDLLLRVPGLVMGNCYSLDFICLLKTHC